MNEGNGNAQGGMGAEVPLRLTRRALFDLRLDDMRRRGEPTEGMSQRAPTPSYSSEDSKEREARGLALIKAHGITSMWSSERERLQRHGEKLQALQDQRDEEQRLWIEEMNAGVRYHSPPTGLGTPVRPTSSFLANCSPIDRNYSQKSRDPQDFRDPRDSLDPRDHQDSRDRHPYPAFSVDARDGSNWRHSTELRLLQEEMIEAAKFKPEARPLFRTVDMNAFSGESIADYEHIPGDGVKAVSSAVPPSFPPHLTVNGVVELGGYLASASYIVSLGGPPLPDLKYGIIVVPTGEEDLLFSGYGDHAGMSAEFKEQIYVRSKEAQKEQVMELRQKALEELANGVSCDPEPDDDDREFYRRRWLARKGINVDEEDTPAGDVVAGGSDAPLHDAGSPQVAVDPLASLGDEQSRQSVRHSNDGDLKQDTASTRQGDTAASADNHVAAGTKTDIIHINGEIPRDDDGHDSQHNGETEPGTKTDLPINWDVHRDDEGHDPQLNGETEPGTNGHMPINREVPRDDDGHDPQLNGEMERAPSTPDTLRSTVGGVSPISHDGCRALEALLRGGKKRRSSRRVLNSLLSNTKLRSTQTPVLAHRDVLLEVATAITRMANGDLSTNPGIDHRLWEAVRKDLAVKPAPS